MALERDDFIATACIPQPRSLVVRAGEDLRAIGARATFTLRESRQHELASLGESRIETEANREISDFSTEDEP